MNVIYIYALLIPIVLIAAFLLFGKKKPKPIQPKCPKCGQPVDPDDDACPHCKTSLAPPEPQKQETLVDYDYYTWEHNSQHGPTPLSHITKRYLAGDLPPATLVQKVGTSDWVALSSLVEKKQ